MKTWFTPSEYADLSLPGLPSNRTSMIRFANNNRWQDRTNAAGEPLCRRREGRGGGFEYHYTLLPSEPLTAFNKRFHPKETTNATRTKSATKAAWDLFDRSPEDKKAKAKMRLDTLNAVQALEQGGLTRDDAVRTVASDAGIGCRTVYDWFRLVDGHNPSDWLPALLPKHVGRTATVECHPDAWALLKSDFLRMARPSFSTCYERLRLAAAEHGWTIPSERTLARRMEQEVPKAVVTYLRKGPEALRRMYPAQERDRTCFHAMEAVNIDGHKWDVFVKWPDGTIGRPIMVAIQDLYSNKFVGWRVDRSENSDLVRLAFADVFRNFGIPYHVYMDNGRGFAAKCISGGTANRYRFKVRPEEPSGILTQLGCEIHWTTPYSGQSKPIERAFRDFCDAIAKHPLFEGAYTGNRPDAKPENYGSRAVPIDQFLQVVEQGIRIHNARPKRNTRVCNRQLSFDEAFDRSYADAVIPRATEEQIRMCLMAAENVKADRQTGAVKILGNRFWSECLHEHVGKSLVVRFDPDALHDGVHVYRLDGAYIGFADCWEAVGFNDTQAARDHARKRRQFQKATKQAAEIERELSIAEIAALLPNFDEPETPAPAVTRLVFGNTAAVAQPMEGDPAPDNFDKHFEAGLRLVEANND